MSILLKAQHEYDIKIYIKVQKHSFSYYLAYKQIDNFKAYASKIDLNKNYKKQGIFSRKRRKMPQNQTFRLSKHPKNQLFRLSQNP